MDFIQTLKHGEYTMEETIQLFVQTQAFLFKDC